MARAFLKDEIQKALAAAIEKLNRASEVIETAEASVIAGIRAGLSASDVNRIGIEGYQAAGILMMEAGSIITDLGPDASTGLYFPRIAAIGAPFGFDQFQVDVESVTGTDRAVIIAESRADALLFPNPWGELVNGEQVILQKINAHIGGASALENRVLQGVVIEVRDKDTTSSKHRLIFETTFTFFVEDAENPTTTTNTAVGRKGYELVLRQISYTP